MKKKMSFMIFMGIICMLYLIQGAVIAASNPQFQLAADKQEFKEGEVIALTLNAKKLNDMYAYEAKFTYNPDKLELIEVKSQIKGYSVAPVKKSEEITIAHTKIGEINGENGDVLIGTLIFKAKESGRATVTWDSMKVVDSKLQSTIYKVIETTSLSISEATVNSVILSDIKGHWAEASILKAAGQGLISGYPDKKFMPNKAITRIEFAVMLSKTLKLDAIGELTFVDEHQIPNWAKADVAKSVKAGLIQGYSDHSFRGDQPITRAEIAAMVMRSLDIKDTDSGKLTFVDSDRIPGWAREWVKAAVAEGIIKGSSANTFLPNDNATRAEATVIILRLLSLK